MDENFIRIKKYSKIYNDINKWLNNINRGKKNKNNSLLILGNHGCGKSYTVDNFIKKNRMNRIGIKDISLEKDINLKDNVVSMIKKEKKNKVLVIDNLEKYTSTVYTKKIINFVKLNEKRMIVPIIFISNKSHSNVFCQLKKILPIKKFENIETKELNQIIEDMIKNNNIEIKENAKDKIVKNSQNDVRKLIQIINEIIKIEGKEINEKTVDEYFNNYKSKNKDVDLFEVTDELINTKTNMHKCIDYYNCEKVKLPIMIHQYYIKKVIQDTNNNNKNINFENILNINNLLTNGDITENYIYSHQDWNLREIHGIITCVLPNYYLHNNNDNNKNKNKKVKNFEFAKDFNKTSIKKINKKNIDKSNNIYGERTIEEYIYINDIINKKIKSGDFDYINKIVDKYKIKKDYIDTLIKINKLNKDNKLLTTKQKKLINNFN